MNQDALNWILKIEGGLVNDPDDAGGETKFGISKAAYPDVDIAALTIEQAGEIYERDYWNKYKCNELDPVPAILLFDAVVQHKPDSAIRIFQRALRVTVDGIIGPQTINKANSLTSAEQFVDDFLSERDVYYHNITIARISNEKFLKGWFRRMHMLQRFLYNNGLLP